MATYTLTISADVSKYIAGLKAIPGATAQQAEKAAIALASANAKSGRSAEEALAQVKEYAAALVKQGVSEKVAAAEAMKYAQAMAKEAEAAQKAAEATTRANQAQAAGSATTRATSSAAQSATGALNATAHAAEDYTVSAAASRAATANLGAQLSDVAVQLQSGTGFGTILMQQGPQIVQAIQMGGGATAMFGGALTTLSAIAGPAAVVVAAVGTAAVVFANSAVTAESQAHDLNEAIYTQGINASQTEDDIKALSAAWDSFTSSLEEAQTHAAVVNGQLEEWEVKAGKAAKAVVSGTRDQILTDAKHVAVLKEQKEAVQSLIDSEQTSSRQLPELFKRRKQINAELQAATATLKEHKEAVVATTEQVYQAARVEEDERIAKENEKNARKGNTKALREEEEALRRLSEAMQAENEAAERSQKVYQGGLDSLAQIREAQRQSIMTDAEKVEASHAATIAQIEADKQRALSATNTITGIETAEQSAREASLAAEAAYLQQLRDLDAKRTENARREAEERAKIEQQTNQAKFQLASAGAGALLSLTQTVSQNMSEEQKKGSMALFIAQKAGAVAQAGINTALAVSNALATPAPPPIPQILAGAALVTGGAAAIQIASAPPPKFHTGTLGSNEYPATYQKGEAVIPAQTMARPGAREQAAALVAGKSATDEEAFARGMDKSATPMILSEILRVLSRQKPQRQTPARPGHRGKYAY